MSERDSMMKISAFTEYTQRSPRTLRYYEELGLRSPQGRTESGFRLDRADQALRLECIDQLKAMGCLLSDIQQLIESWRSKPIAQQGMRFLGAAYQCKFVDVRSATKRLTAIESEIAESIKFLTGCYDCHRNISPEEAYAQCMRVAEHRPPLIRGITERSLSTSS